MEKSPKVWGPKPHGRGYRLYFRVDGKTRATPTVATEADAEKLKKALLRELNAVKPQSIGLTLDRYESYLKGKGNKDGSIRCTLTRLRDFFPEPEAPIGELTAKECIGLYHRLLNEDRPATKRRLAVDTHRNTLAEAKSFLKWCVSERLLSSNPLQSVSGQGRRKRGKAQLGIDESRRLSSTALERARQGDTGALAVVLLIHTGPRASELTNLRVRDLDDGGRLLWIRPVHDGSQDHLKTPAARRALNVPAVLQQFLLELAAGRPAGDFLFGRHWRDWPREQTERLCELAKVPRVTAHGLRGLKSSLALISGEDPEAVARTLGHSSSRVTFDSYAAPGTRERIEQRRLEHALEGKDSSSLITSQEGTSDEHTQ